MKKGEKNHLFVGGGATTTIELLQELELEKNKVFW
jgi:hypothetical protein